MTTLTMKKSVDEIEQPEPIQEDWYMAIVTKAPEIKPNKKKQNGLSYEEGAGDNLIIPLRIVSDDDADGRSFTLYLPYPEDKDDEKFNPIGMKIYDAKMERIVAFAEAATGCVVDENEITILPNAQVGVYVQVEMDQQGENLINSIEWFKHSFLPPDQVEMSETEDDEDDDDII